MSPSAAYGSAIHGALQYLHNFYLANKNLTGLVELQAYFANDLKLKRLNVTDEKKFMQRGLETLDTFLKLRGSLINQNQLTEQSFYSQGVMVGDAKLTGRLDVLQVTKQDATVIDYKTSKSMPSWDYRNKTEYEKINLHHYKQQLLFYKLLIEGSRTWGDKGVKLSSAELVFVEPDSDGDIITLPLELNDKEEIARLIQLTKAVWVRIQNLDFPDVTTYPPTEKGIVEFENWLIDNS
jgi:DNA helicase-2/ATP-dependent DNA helicase PcrA